MKLVEIKTSEDRIEAQRLKNLNKYPSLIAIMDAQARQEQQREQAQKARVKKFYILSGIIIGGFVLMIAGSIGLRVMMSSVQSKALEKEIASQKTELTTLVDYKGDDGLFLNNAENLKANDGSRLESVRVRLMSMRPSMSEYSSDLKEIWLIYTPDQDKELRNRIVGVYELTATDGSKIYQATLIDNITYNDDTSLNLDNIGLSEHYGPGGYGYYSDYKMLKLMEIDHFGPDYEITAVEGGNAE